MKTTFDPGDLTVHVVFDERDQSVLAIFTEAPDARAYAATMNHEDVSVTPWWVHPSGCYPKLRPGIYR